MTRFLFDTDFRHDLDELALAVRRLSLERRRRRVPGSGQEFADHRDYVPGDDIRYIDWSVFGRLEKLVLRIFESEQPPHVTLLVDESRSMGLGDPPRFDAIRRLAAALAYTALSREGHVGLMAFADEASELPPRSGRGVIEGVFDFLRSRTPHGATGLDRAAQQLVHGRRRRGPAVILTDGFETDDIDAAVRRLRYARFDVLLVQVLNSDELDPPRRRLVTLRAAESPRRLRLTQTGAVRRRYLEALARHRERLGALCAGHGAAFASVAASDDPCDAVLGLFRRGMLSEV